MSQCVKNGTEVRLQCSMETLEDYYYFFWDPPDDHEDWLDGVDYESYGGRDITFNATWIGSGYDIHEISCSFDIDGNTHYPRAVTILTGRQMSFWYVIGSGYDIHKISCYFDIDAITHSSHAVIILTGRQM